MAEPAPPSSATGPILVCGLGHVGTCVVRLLRRLGLPVVVITRIAREDWLRSARSLGVKVLIGDARDSNLLLEAGLMTAAGLLAVTDQDIVNIEIALDAHRHRPGLPVVIRLFDSHLGQSLEQSLGLRRAVGVSTLVAPAFAAAVFGEHLVGALSLGDQRYVIGRLPADPLHALTPSELRARHHATVLPVGDPELPVRYVLAEEESFRRLAATLLDHRGPHLRGAVAPSRSLWERLRRARRSNLVREAWNTAPRSLRATFLVLLLLIVLSVFVFRAALKLSLLDALYFMITTVTTTGYGDITPRGAGALVQLYACVVMLLGSAMTATLYSFVTDLLITERLRAVLGKPRMPEGDHVIVAGLGNVGHRVVEQLSAAGVPVVVVNRDDSRDFVKAAQVPVVIGDARLPAVLREAGVERAAALIAATGDEAVNLGVGLSAKSLRPGLRTVVRLFAADLASKVQRGLRVDAALSAAHIAAPSLVAAVIDGAQEAFEAEGYLLSLCAHTVGADWDGKSAAELAETGVEVLLRREGARVDVFLPDERLIEGQQVIVLRRRPLQPPGASRPGAEA